jgi:hypothetical protein
VYDYVDGKVDWMAYGQPVEGDEGPFLGAELRAFLRDRLVAEGRSGEEAERFLDDLGVAEVP